MKVDVSGLADAVQKELMAYSQKAANEVKIATDKVAAQGVAELRTTSPKDTGKYQRGWRKETVYEDRAGKRVVVRNTRYQLTHLLERGHAKRNGGRVAAKPHIHKVEDKMIGEFEKSVRKALSDS
ncbi:HK97 gp10 family phage protein [Gehongia tenuis]|uniref:HK97 gp10 family phage protein n=1 Tax=Gehongia tenuis TaxID=2763655 RepID=A0A926D5P1_9FIRM|nr:HK97 gp10 family phage protein [Gehongia tenuis]MBC8531807.1 HK97 gp10 family phage protein [Gehongia tenuis]